MNNQIKDLFFNLYEFPIIEVLNLLTMMPRNVSLLWCIAKIIDISTKVGKIF